MKACTKVALTTICRNCGKPLHRKTDFYFTLRGVEYWICHRCRHKTAITKT